MPSSIIAKHTDPDSGTPEVVFLGFCDNEVASEHISRYILASAHAHGLVLDCAAGSCYGSSILRRNGNNALIISVDIDKNLLLYGKKVFNADGVCADATHLPFREASFDSTVSIETLEHLRDPKAFLSSIQFSLVHNGDLILSTPNKLYNSPFLPRPLNPYHVREYYLGPLLLFLEKQGFKASRIYKGRKETFSVMVRRVLNSLLKFLLKSARAKTYLVDDLYSPVKILLSRKSGIRLLLDPDPSMFKHEELKVASNVVLCQYFVICAHKL